MLTTNEWEGGHAALLDPDLDPGEADRQPPPDSVRARYYDPNVGQFVSEDPDPHPGDNSNLYRYAMNSPTNFTDPTGTTPFGEFGDWADDNVIRPVNHGLKHLGHQIGVGLTHFGNELTKAVGPFDLNLGIIDLGSSSEGFKFGFGIPFAPGILLGPEISLQRNSEGGVDSWTGANLSVGFGGELGGSLGYDGRSFSASAHEGFYSENAGFDTRGHFNFGGSVGLGALGGPFADGKGLAGLAPVTFSGGYGSGGSFTGGIGYVTKYGNGATESFTYAHGDLTHSTSTTLDILGMAVQRDKDGNAVGYDDSFLGRLAKMYYENPLYEGVKGLFNGDYQSRKGKVDAAKATQAFYDIAQTETKIELVAGNSSSGGANPYSLGKIPDVSLSLDGFPDPSKSEIANPWPTLLNGGPAPTDLLGDFVYAAALGQMGITPDVISKTFNTFADNLTAKQQLGLVLGAQAHQTLDAIANLNSSISDEHDALLASMPTGHAFYEVSDEAERHIAQQESYTNDLNAQWAKLAPINGLFDSAGLGSENYHFGWGSYEADFYGETNSRNSLTGLSAAASAAGELNGHSPFPQGLGSPPLVFPLDVASYYYGAQGGLKLLSGGLSFGTSLLTSIRGLDSVATGPISSDVEALYLQRVVSPGFQAKLWLHNQLAGLVGARTVTAYEIGDALASTEFREATLSNVLPSGQGFIVGGSTRGGYFANEIADHELLHIGQYLRNPAISTSFPMKYIHELVPSYIGSPVIYSGGSAAIFGGGYQLYKWESGK